MLFRSTVMVTGSGTLAVETMVFSLINDNDPDLAKLKDGVIIVNTSRARAINGKDMLKYLKNGKISAFVSDVFWDEPAKEDYEIEMLKLDNVMITPHLGAQTREAQKRIAIMTADNIINEW